MDNLDAKKPSWIESPTMSAILNGQSEIRFIDDEAGVAETKMVGEILGTGDLMSMNSLFLTL